MPSMFGKDSKKKELIKNLDQIYLQLQREHQISPGDFPELKKMQVNPKPKRMAVVNWSYACLNVLNILLFYSKNYKTTTSANLPH